ncbi:lipid-A-disaccharide synthase [soil metagenome]
MATIDRQIMIVAGEASGDLHAAKLVRAIHKNDPAHNYRFFGATGPRLREAGVETIFPSDELSIVGLAEIARALPTFWRARNALLAAANSRKPDAVILVDFPDFNLKLARSLKKQGIRVIYYISPQVWAWRKYRLGTIKRHVDLLLTILPFEKEWFREHGVSNVQYVGSPLAREVFPTLSQREFCGLNGLDPLKPVVALLPGSRQKEIARILPEMIGAALVLRRKDPNIQFAVAAASRSCREQISSILETLTARDSTALKSVRIVENETYNLLYAANAAAVTSGTATMEAGIIGTPLVIVYKTSRLNYTLLEPLISVEHYGLINLIAGDRVAAELIQDEFTPATLSSEILHLLDPAENSRHREQLRAATEKLGQGGASKRAAKLIVELISSQEGGS